jgi:hypothetical protein
MSLLPSVSGIFPEAAPVAYDDSTNSIIGERLTIPAFYQLSGKLGGYPFVKVVVDKETSLIHFINNNLYNFHVDYIGLNLLHLTPQQLDTEIDKLNHSFYFDPARRFYLGILSLHEREGRQFFSIETVEVDTMNVEMAKYFYKTVKTFTDSSIPLLLKPANHIQEFFIKSIDPAVIPRIYSHELFATAEFIPLNTGDGLGRLRVFKNEHDYTKNKDSIEWYDIIVMDKVPDNIPRISGIINAQHTTPLSHTNVLASGWQIPNCIQIGVLDKIEKDNLDGKWVKYSVRSEMAYVQLNEIEKPEKIAKQPTWTIQKIQIEEPVVSNTSIVNLNKLRTTDNYKYGTKAANLGELSHILNYGSSRLIRFYKIPRPPRANLMPYLTKLLNYVDGDDVSLAALQFLKDNIRIPRGIAIPFSMQQEFLESSPKIQQAIGKLKMALELDIKQVDALCLNLQALIKSARMPNTMRDYIDAEISETLGGVSKFVIRSSSNAEDLTNFSAAGIYESVNHVATAANIFESIKTVWASLVSPRSVRLRQDVGISLDASYMGVIIQEEVSSEMGGVLVTANPSSKTDFRNVYLNVSSKSVINIVQGTEQPYQYLYNTVEGGGRTLSLGSSRKDLSDKQKDTLQKLAIAGRLLQSHFSQDYTFSTPADIEWLVNESGIYILQLRPYAR